VTRDDVAEYLLSTAQQDNKKRLVESLVAIVEVMKDPGRTVVPSRDPYRYIEFFQSRYRKLRAISKQRVGMNTVRSAREFNAKSDMIGGLVLSRKLKRDLVELVIEDENGSCEVLISDENVKREAESLCLDQYVTLQVQRSRSGSIFASKILWPDIPDHRMKASSDDDVYAVFTSDLQVGSRSFMRSAFEKFIAWLNGEGKEVEQASRVRYLLIAGDLVDGVGVYPDQGADLILSDVHDQYRELVELLARIPKRIKIVLIPGNHDCVRQGLPQPPIPRAIAPDLYKLENVLNLGNPCEVKIHGVRVLMFHGTSLDDVFASIPGVSYESPTSAMKVLLKARHIAPIYGHRTPIVATTSDHLVIEEVPDIMHTGHIHTVGTEMYHGTLMISSGTWQAQTPYQLRMGIKPNPGVVAVVNLRDLSVTMQRFS